MKLVELFPIERVFVGVDVASRRDLLAFFAQKAAELGLVDRQDCQQGLADREDLGSTGLGNGIAIPHTRIEGLDHAIGMFATLARPIDFEAVDQEPVDITFMLILPEQASGEPMKALSRVAKIARQEPITNALRRAQSSEEALAIFQKADAEL
ncbi:PTS sugar transporter subunit IIA [Devosia aurantiaca]|uniref:PTS sugar transporter subunit IIA n=1 Tax=Devosia aurantiaca TaxID=2714858 RepID=A0A6M1SB64_9HYPH|nr:PTS sugar transporter subunit IIA [Devosia aurantiaca]NGP17189.1 PTS sugar transporter subunit IIA [Devosia aurantiaca]